MTLRQAIYHKLPFLREELHETRIEIDKKQQNFDVILYAYGKDFKTMHAYFDKIYQVAQDLMKEKLSSLTIIEPDWAMGVIRGRSGD